ncbi:MAG: hypothetical protein HUJ56_10400, partial [Erysipelotrichaceae bacterium]|nr:hypothetical protein [Erysipelotrichaceae bacterium]
GGLVGEMTSGTVDNSYNAGTVKNSATVENNHGALVGNFKDALIGEEGEKELPTITDSFFVSGENKGIIVGPTATDNGKPYSGVNKPFGNLNITEQPDTRAEGLSKWVDGNSTVYSGSFTTMSDSDTLIALRNGENEWMGDVDNTSKDNVHEKEGAHTWLTYEYTTLPLLYDLMIDETLQRVFEYDGSTHNLKTIDVDDLYGMANFEGDHAGRDVITQGYELNEEKTNSIYHYNSTNMWAPQHSYRTKSNATLEVTTHGVDVTVTGERLYGQHNLLGYFVYVPAYGIEEAKFYFVTAAQDPVERIDKGKYINFADFDKATPAQKELIQAALVDLGLDNKFYEDPEAAKIFKDAVNKNGSYLVTIGNPNETNTLVAGETVDAVLQGFLEKKDTEQKGMDFFDTAVDLQKNKVGSYDITNVQGIDNTGKNYFYAKSTQPAVAKDVYYKPDDGKYYTHINPEDGKKYDDKEFEVDVYTSGNYTLTYNGTLTIDKANLYYTYDGIKTYGDTSNTITAGSKITLVGKDDNSEAESVNGYLKDWDLSNTALKKVGDQYTIDLTKNDGLKNNASKIVLAVVEGKTAVAKQDTDNDNLLYYTIDSTNLYIDNLTGKVYNYDLTNHKIGAEYNVTKTTSLIQKVINPGGTTNVSDRIYHVKGSKESPEKYQVLWTEIAPASNGKLSDNYNFVFVGEGEHQTTYTKSATKEGVTKYEYRDKVEVTKGEGEAAKEYDDYLYTQSKTIKAAASTQLINPKQLEVTIIGQRDYGTNMITTEYKTNGTTSLVDNYWYVNTNTTNKELKRWDKLDNDSILKIISGIETKVDSTTKISQYTNSRSSEEGNKGYDLKDPSETKDPINNRTYSDSKVDVTKTKEGTTTSIVLQDINADDYIVSNGNHNLTIDPSELIIKIKGEKIYGEANQTEGTDYEYHIEGLKLGDKIGVLENNAKDVDWQTRDDIEFTINSDHLRDTDYDAKNNTHLINLDANLGNFDGEGVSIKEGAEYQYDISKGRYLNAKEDAYKKQGYNDRTENGGLFINDITNVGGFISTNYDIKYYTEYTVHQRGVNIDTTADRVYGDQVTVDNVKINNNDYAYDVEVREKIQTDPEKWTTTGVTQLDNYFLRDRDLTKVVNKDYFATIDNSDAWLDVRYDTTNNKVIGYGFADDYDFIKKIVTEEWIQTDFKNDEETPELKNLTTNYKMNSKGNDTLTITPAYLQISITGSKVYGEETIGLDDTKFVGSGAPLTYTYYTSTDGKTYTEGMLAGDETTLSAEKYVVSVSQLKDNDNERFNTGKYLDVGTYTGQVTIQPVPDPVPPEGGANAANLLASTTAGNVYTDQAIEVKNWDDLSIAGTDGIDIVNKKIIVQKGFNQNNFKTIETDSTYEVTPRPMTLTIDGRKTYGEDTTDSGLSGHTVDKTGYAADQYYQYKVTGNGQAASGFASGESFAGLDGSPKQADVIELDATKKLTDGEAGDLGKGKYLNAGTYSINAKGVEITNWDDLNNYGKAQTDTGFKDSNYAITYAGNYVVEKRKVAVDTEAERVYGYKYDTIDTTKGGKVTYTADNHFAGKPGEKYTGFVAGDGSEKLKLEEMLTTKDVSSEYLDVKYNADNTYAAYVDTQTDLQTGSINNITTDFKTAGVPNNYEAISVNEKLTITPAYMKVTVTGSKTYGEKTAGLDGTTGAGSALNYEFKTGLTADKITDTAHVGDQFSKTGTNAVTIDTSRLTDNDVAPYNQGVYLDVTTVQGTPYYGGYKGTTSVDGLTGEITVTDPNAKAADATSKAILLTNLKNISVTDEISGIGDAGFNLKNYKVVYTESDYDVNPANLSVNIKGQKTYGDATDSTASSSQFQDKDGKVQVTLTGLKN